MDKKLGRLPNDPSKPRLLFAKYTEEKPTYPDRVDYISDITYPMYLNDKIGDCTIAGAAHMIQAISKYGQGVIQTLTDDDVVSAYEANTGYDPSTGANDDGAVMQDVLNYWRKTGIGGHNILAFAEVDVNNTDEIRNALSTFGALYIGINFPDSAMEQFDSGKPWDVQDGANLDGGHAIHGGFYDVNGNYKVTTWGAIQEMTPAFWNEYVEEAWVVITPEWLNAAGTSPSGLNLNQLGEDLAELTGGVNPFPTPEPNPTPTPVVVSNDDLASFLSDFLPSHDLSALPVLQEKLQDWLASRT